MKFYTKDELKEVAKKVDDYATKVDTACKTKKEFDAMFAEFRANLEKLEKVLD